MAKKKRLFLDSGRQHGTVILNWRGDPKDEFTYFAESFWQLAQDSVARLKKNPKFGLDGPPSHDFQAYPIVFLYRHALELYLKSILLVGSPMLAIKDEVGVDRDKLLGNHNLDILRQDVERVFAAFGWGWDLRDPHFRTVQDFRAVVSEFHSVDVGSHAFRYPLDTKGAPSLSARFRFNLFEFSAVLDELFKTLAGAAIGARYQLDDVMQMIAERRQDGYGR